MAELGKQTVRLSELVKITAEQSYSSLEELVSKSSDLSDTEKKIGLLKYIDKTRQRLLRLYALTNWCTQIPFLQHCQQLEGSLSNHDLCFTQAADSLFLTHNGLQQARAPLYDVPSALEVLLTGSYYRLPRCIEDIGMQTVLDGEERELALPKLDTLLRSQLLEVSLPKEISSVTVSDGRVVLHVEGEFKVQLTLGYRGHLSLWRILHLELLIGERSGPLKLSELQRFSIGDDLERRMAAAENPFAMLYSVLHEFCIALVMDTVIRQVKTLRQGRWKDAIHFELISDINSGQGANIGHRQVPPDGEGREVDTSGMKTPGIKVMYWLDLIKGVGGGNLSIPFLKIEPGHDQRITCSHNDNIFVIDPMTGNEAEFVLNQSCIDVECLLLRAISCYIHTRLLEVQRVLKSNDQLCHDEDDIILKHPGNDPDLNKISDYFKKSSEADVGELGEELLCVRAYGLSYVVLGISIRNGRFLLPSRNLVPSSAIKECEEALNQGNLAFTEVFTSLRNKSILHLFASIGKFLGLKVYEKGLATVKIPKSIRQGSDLLLMSIPNCGKSYFLLIQLDVDFKPLFTMLQSHQDSTGCHHIFRFIKFDIGRIQIVEEEVNLSLLYNEWSLRSAKETRGSDIISESGPNSNAVIQGLEGLKSSFSSVVDDVFQFDKEVPLRQYLPKQKNDLSSAERSSSSPLGAGDGLPIYSANRQTCVPSLHASPAHKSSIQNSRSYPKSSLTGQPQTMLKSLASGSHVISPVCQTSDCGTSLCDISVAVPKYEITSRKRCLSDLVHSIPSLQQIADYGESQKKRKTACESGNPQPIIAQLNTQSGLEEFVGRSYEDVLMEANHDKALLRIYATVLLQVVTKCFVFIKQGCLTSQMKALGICYSQHSSIENPSADIWFRLPSSREDGLKKIGLWLGNSCSTYWDVKVNDEYFRDLWELHKGKTGTPWGSGVRITNNSDVDSHIQYGPEGVVLSYSTLEENSVQKLVADLQRLSNARSFAMGMRRYLGVKPDEGIGTGKENCNMKTLNPMKIGASEGRDRTWELIRRTFRIRAVGLTSLRFSYFGSMPGSIAHFIVEWERGKEGCTMHISPDQLWPQTKSLEDFINEGEVDLLLDCIRVTAGPLHALSGAIRPTRMVGTASTGVAVVPSSITSRGLGTVPSSLLPTDVSVALQSPYWISILYRKKFAVDMRCFVDDHVWLQPAIPPKGGPDVGGSMPCPEFQQVIMNSGMTMAEHVRGEVNTTLNELGNDSGYGGGWVPLASLENVLHGLLKYLGVLWLFYQLLDILRSKQDEKLLSSLDCAQPTLSFCVRGYMFVVGLLPVREQPQPQLHLQVISVDNFNQRRQQQQQLLQTNNPDQLNNHEIGEICDFFSRRVASEPYDASRVASFISLLLLPISVLQEFLRLIAWKKGIAQRQGADTAPSQRPCIELCLESHIGSNFDALMPPDNAGLSDKAAGTVAKSNIHYDRPHNAVDFGLIVALDPDVNASGGAAWLPHCVSVRLKYVFGENPHVSLLSMEGSHCGRAEDWECCKRRVAKAVEIAGRGSGASGSSVDGRQGRLQLVAETLQQSLQSSLLQL